MCRFLRYAALPGAADGQHGELGSHMASWGADWRRRRALLRALAGELGSSCDPGRQLRPRLRYGFRLMPYVSVRMACRRRMRVYCVSSNTGRYALLTDTGQVIRLNEDVSGVARAIAAACAWPGPPGRAAGQAAAVHPGP